MTSRVCAPQTPLGALIRGVLAGAVGTVAMDLLWFYRYKRGGGESGFLDWEFSAGLDVWWEEPERGEPFRPRLPFLDLPNVLGSPHNSGIVPGMTERAAACAARNVVRFLAGEPPRGVQRPEDYSSSARIE